MSSTNGISLNRQHPDIMGNVPKELGVIDYQNVEINVYEDYRGRRWECWWVIGGDNFWYTQKVSEPSLLRMQQRVDEFLKKGFIPLPWNYRGDNEDAQKILESHLGVKVKPEVFQSNGAIRFVVGS